MSAPRSNPPNGPNANAPNPNAPNPAAPNAAQNAAAMRIPASLRRRTAAASNPLVGRRKHDPSKTMNRPASTQRPSSTAYVKATPKDPLIALKEQNEKRLKDFEAQRKKNGGWTNPPPQGEFMDYPLVISKRALDDDTLFHVMRFSHTKGGQIDHTVDPTDPNDFTRPVVLHRRDAQQPAAAREVKDEAAVEEEPAKPTMDEKEAERLEKLKAEKEAQRQEDLAKIAPGVKTANAEPAQKKTQKKEKPFNAHFHTKKTADPKAGQLRYAEALPWHIEDADGKNVWFGQYVAPLSRANVGLVISGQGFKMIPLEKYYRFIAKPAFKGFSLEEAEAQMKQKLKMPIWAEKGESKEAKAELAATRRWMGGGSMVKQESSTYRAAPRSEKVDHDDVDMSGDEFQDDDEAPTMERDNDEDAKDARERQRRDHMGANLFGEADEKEVDEEETAKMLEDAVRKMHGKKVRKALTRHEKHLEYQSDSDSNPYASSSDEEEEKPDEEKKDEANGKDGEKEKESETKDSKDPKDAKDKKAAAKGSGAAGKSKADATKGPKSLKRPGSPNLSESSGNESTRKKAKKTATSSVQPSRSGTPLPQRTKVKPAGSATSDGEATGGEMSDGGLKKKKLSKLGGTGTPGGSRAGSPVPSQGPVGSSSAGVSPKKGTPVPDGPGQIITREELLAALEANPNGISIGDLLKRYFSDRVGDGENKLQKNKFISLVTRNSIFRKADKLLLPKPKKEAS
ncbi:hypothetical protein GGTG_08799 [Gaeumannomyces tritici R3-111a-1]|uniref:Uncharacterized protein n=1 Tax=Gaeumannomyces tritici (strain R3-111a-1) TaxID=644352 RepID=J3P5K9_GAET3|nr:hypothetical protein GGTG_08799 [Gaeumannomyces tritici R3-111a-1]EJT74961.1 hypothetical protein GGTG_08799 [Gaeumannomyces tritici R3-111a-1]